MAWNEECQVEIEKTLATQDLSEVVTKAVTTIVTGYLDSVMVMLHGSSPSGCDPNRWLSIPSVASHIKRHGEDERILPGTDMPTFREVRTLVLPKWKRWFEEFFE